MYEHVLIRDLLCVFVFKTSVHKRLKNCMCVDCVLDCRAIKVHTETILLLLVM